MRAHLKEIPIFRRKLGIRQLDGGGNPSGDGSGRDVPSPNEGQEQTATVTPRRRSGLKIELKSSDRTESPVRVIPAARGGETRDDNRGGNDRRKLVFSQKAWLESQRDRAISIVEPQKMRFSGEGVEFATPLGRSKSQKKDRLEGEMLQGGLAQWFEGSSG